MSEQIETCRTSGHVWRELLGGKRCDRCGKQRAVPLITGHIASAHEWLILHEMNLIYEIIGQHQATRNLVGLLNLGCDA